MIFKTTFCVFAVFVMIGSVSVRAATEAELCPSGNVEVIRVSKMMAGGTMAGIQKAVADHGKWYASHGYPEDKIILAPVLSYDASAKGLAKSNSFVTIHSHSRDVPQGKHDAAWDAYVAEYNANSTITSTTFICAPK